MTRDEVRVAQTNLQLYEELAERAYSPGEIAVVREAYALAMVLFASLYRATGKPFVAHAVGTASVLVAADAPIDLVAAALLHSAYTLGDFGSLLRRISPAKRARLRTAIGSSAEGLVARYAALTWGAPTVRAALAAPPSSDERAVLLFGSRTRSTSSSTSAPCTRPTQSGESRWRRPSCRSASSSPNGSMRPRSRAICARFARRPSRRRGGRS